MSYSGSVGNYALSGVPNTGSGSGGGGLATVGADGASGIVVLRYAVA